MKPPPRRLFVLAFASWLVASAPWQSGDLVIDAGMHHLGNDPTPEWDEASSAPEGTSLELEFEATSNPIEWTLHFSQRSVATPWDLALNGVAIGNLGFFDPLREDVLPLAPGLLRDGRNVLTLRGEDPMDDVTFGRVRLSMQPMRQALKLGHVKIRVTDGDGAPVPARVTIAGMSGGLPRVYSAARLHQAVRDGVVYTDHGLAELDLPEGPYRVYATRGSEWSLATADLTVVASAAEEAPVGQRPTLVIQRVVDTSGFVATDTHVHTLTFSGHGDSSVEERMVTLAGEGVELAIATDHNHNTDYRPYQSRMDLSDWFTPVVGNEVTTPIGHFNAFPLDPAAEVPAYEVRDVALLIEGIRRKGAQVVILNHPRWPSHEEGPFGVIELDHGTGANTAAWGYSFDAVELINSCTEEASPMLLFEDWFALLNRGERVGAVGSSDSHTVGDPVGGGRTYVASATDDPDRIDVDAACRAILEGRTSIAMGIFVVAQAVVHDPGSGAVRVWGMGDLVTVADRSRVRLEATLRAPRWIEPTQATLFVNGTPRVFELGPSSAKPDAACLEWQLSADLADMPQEDAWAVWIVEGKGIDGPFWPLHNDYTLGATNPIYLDLDGDGIYSGARQTAARLVKASGGSRKSLIESLRNSWSAVAVHAFDLMDAQVENQR